MAEDIIDKVIADLNNQIDGSFQQFKDYVNQLIIENNNLQKEIQSIKEKANSESHKSVIKALKKEREEIQKELWEARQQNADLKTELKDKESVTQQALDFAKSVLQSNPTTGK